MTVLVGSLFSIGAFAGVLILLGVVQLWRRREVAEGRRNPLTRNLLRSPGQSIRTQLDDLRWDVAMYLCFGMLPIPLAGGLALANWVDVGKPPSGIIIATLSISAFGTIAWIGWKLWNALREIRNLRLGHDAELAVGQELSELMQHGYRVFHDFPVDERSFNIDHVVAGPGGVFAVETKGRSKPSSKNSRGSNWEVAYDGSSLQFPGWRETDPIVQVKAAANWLQKWLSSAVGEPIEVRPVLILPGWYIKQTSTNEIPVLASGQIAGYFTKRRSLLVDRLIQRVAHQLEQKCRDVTPSSFQAREEEKA